MNHSGSKTLEKKLRTKFPSSVSGIFYGTGIVHFGAKSTVPYLWRCCFWWGKGALLIIFCSFTFLNISFVLVFCFMCSNFCFLKVIRCYVCLVGCWYCLFYFLYMVCCICPGSRRTDCNAGPTQSKQTPDREQFRWREKTGPYLSFSLPTLLAFSFFLSLLDSLFLIPVWSHSFFPWLQQE